MKQETHEAKTELVAQFGRGLAANPDNVALRTTLAGLLLGMGQGRAALAVCNGAPPESGEHEPLLRLGVRSAVASHRPVDALHWLHELAALRPDDVQVRLSLGDTMALLGDLPGSLEAFRGAVALAADDAPTQHRIEITERRIDALAGSGERYAAALGAGAAPGSAGARTYLVTYGTSGYAESQTFVNRTAVTFGGIDAVVPWTEDRLAATGFFARHHHILSAPIGSGYWLWKPYIILDLLEQVRHGDWVIYSDIGREHPYALYHSVEPLTRWAVATNGGLFPGVYIPDCGRNARWTKRDCFVRMGCDAPNFWQAPQVQASFSLWQKNAAALAFVRQWLAYCTDRAILSDEPNICGLPNLPDFVEHRRDQSVLTNLTLQRDVRAFGSPDQPLAPAGRLKSLDTVVRLAAKAEGVAPQPQQRRARG